MKKLLGFWGLASAFIRSHRKAVGIGIAAVLCAAVIWRATDYGRLRKENRELHAEISNMENELSGTLLELEDARNALGTARAQLSYTENELDLLKRSETALIGQVAGLNETIDGLNSQIEELLNVREKLPVITRSQLEARIESIKELTVRKYIYRNAAEKEGSKTWLWGWTLPFSDTSILATYDGVIRIGADLTGIKFNVNEGSRTITVTLPPSKILDHNIPQETINVLQARDSLFSKITFNDYNKFISAEKPIMEEVAISQGVLAEADHEISAYIRAVLEALPGMDTYDLKFN